MDELIIRNKYKVVDRTTFPCDACGACCSIYALVDLHITDIFRMSEKLGITPKEFFEKYVQVIEKDGAYTFAMNIEGGCKFLKDKKCTIYEARSDFCSFYPNSHSCFDLSQVQKKEMKPGNPGCAAHRQPDDLILVPDLERMVDSRIFYMVKETYLAQYGGVYDEEGMKAAHQKGLSQIANPRMRNIVHLQVMTEFMENIPVDEKTGEPALTKDEVKMIYQKMRENHS
ncbi:MAG TPA: YkgJ family cysteine cluster protein [Methanocella sp.]|uniref:YkgJ family cysteine cluster protein n=1 Tax=Methanocella sp. TaxID=2052833 RepID=UPI002C81D475|nr:YkgJ family cysteine cluster protein [Methanocella sp.]HTY90977.1 YkgJ family cysteine cluster protein [Methanocella sp.]